MKCTSCEEPTIVLDSVYNKKLNTVHNKYKCTKCGKVFEAVDFEVEITDKMFNNWFESCNKKYKESIENKKEVEKYGD